MNSESLVNELSAINEIALESTETHSCEVKVQELDAEWNMIRSYAGDGECITLDQRLSAVAFDGISEGSASDSHFADADSST